jgi:enoyl-CoA hydratase/carnithine racemase
MNHLLVDDADGVRTITFDRPEAKNAGQRGQRGQR